MNKKLTAGQRGEMLLARAQGGSRLTASQDVKVRLNRLCKRGLMKLVSAGNYPAFVARYDITDAGHAALAESEGGE